jgi:hypothetical protein
MTVDDVEDGKIKSFSIKTHDDGCDNSACNNSKEEDPNTIYIPLDKIDSFNKECNEAILNDERAKAFLKQEGRG